MRRRSNGEREEIGAARRAGRRLWSLMNDEATTATEPVQQPGEYGVISEPRVESAATTHGNASISQTRRAAPGMGRAARGGRQLAARSCSASRVRRAVSDPGAELARSGVSRFRGLESVCCRCHSAAWRSFTDRFVTLELLVGVGEFLAERDPFLRRRVLVRSRLFASLKTHQGRFRPCRGCTSRRPLGCRPWRGCVRPRLW